MSDPATNSTSRCPRCDAEFNPAASPMGLCPACLLKLGASDPGWKLPPSEPAASAEVVTAPPPPVVRRSTSVHALKWIVGGAITATALAYFLLRVAPSDPRNAPLSAVVRFTLPWPDDTSPVDGAQFAVSPDGSRIALAARGQDGQARLWIRTLQSLEWRVLPRTEGAALPFWSPDSRHIGFFAERKLKRIDVSNDLTQTVCDALSGRGGTWSHEGTIVFAPSPAGPLFRVSASGGTAQPVTTLDQLREGAHAWPHFLPDGNSVLFAATGVGQAHSRQGGLHVLSLDSGRRKVVADGAGAGAFAQGVLVFVHGTQLVAQQFDPKRLALSGDRHAISGAERVVDSAGKGAAFSVSATGVLVHQPADPPQSQLTWIDRSGQVFGMGEPADYQQFSLSPDGRRIAVARRDASESRSNIWLIDLTRQTPSRQTMGPSYDTSPVWLPDGSRIAFVSRRDDGEHIYVTEASGGGKEQILLKSPEAKRLDSVSPDGRFLSYEGLTTSAGWDLWLIPLGGDGKPQPLYQTPFNESDAQFSPDGRWIAYVSDESGRDEVYVRPFPQADHRWQVSIAGGHRPKWRRDGRELFFVAPDGRLLAAPAQGSDSFQTAEPRALFHMRHADDYEVTPDGHRFLARTPVREHDRDNLQVILNWTAELVR